MSITQYSAKPILDKVVGGVNFSEPSTWYVGLSFNPIEFDGTGESEPVGGSYARVAILNNKSNWSTAVSSSTSATLSNTTSIEFTESTGDWGLVTSVFLANSSGEIWFHEVLSTPRTVEELTTVFFEAGGIEFEMSNA